MKRYRGSPGFTTQSFDAVTQSLSRVHREDCLYLLQAASSFGRQRLLELCIGEVSAIFDKIPMEELENLDYSVFEVKQPGIFRNLV